MKTLFSDITIKSKELLAINEIEPVYTFGSKDPNSFDNIIKRQEKLMNELEELAVQHKTILGRVIRFPMGDSYAFYLVTKINKTSARLTWIRFCDAWQDDRIGYEANVDLKYVMQKVKQLDALNAMFSK
jgi:hypothetical protein